MVTYQMSNDEVLSIGVPEGLTDEEVNKYCIEKAKVIKEICDKIINGNLEPMDQDPWEDK